MKRAGGILERLATIRATGRQAIPEQFRVLRMKLGHSEPAKISVDLELNADFPWVFATITGVTTARGVRTLGRWRRLRNLVTLAI